MVIPCKNCLLLPVCRYKPYITLMNDCIKLRNTIYQYGTEGKRLTIKLRRGTKDGPLVKLHQVLNPPAWELKWAREGKRYKIVHNKLPARKGK